MTPTVENVIEIAEKNGIPFVHGTADNALNLWAGPFPTGAFIGEIPTENAVFDEREFLLLQEAIVNAGFTKFDMFMDFDLNMERF